MNTYRSVLAMLGLSFATSLAVFGQGTTVDIGPRLGVDVADVDEVFLGVDVRVGVPTLPVLINPTFDYYFTDSGFDFYQFSANALYSLTSDAIPNIAPYAGAGLGISHSSVDVDLGTFGSFSGGDTDIGINLIGGGSIDAGGFQPFAQVQVTLLGDVDLLTITVGAAVRISG